MIAERITVGVVVDQDAQVERVVALDEAVSQLGLAVDVVLVINGLGSKAMRALLNLLDKLSDTTLLVLDTVVENDFARLVVLDNAIGDRVLLIDIDNIDVPLWRQLIHHSAQGCDVVMVREQHTPDRSAYAFIRAAFLGTYRVITGLPILNHPAIVRIYSRSAALFLVNHENNEMLLKCSSLGPGFEARLIELSQGKASTNSPSPYRDIKKAYRALYHFHGLPIRTMVIIALFGAIVSVVYSAYTLFAYFFASDLARGWATLSLQISGMLFLFSILFAMLGEHILSIERNIAHRLNYRVVREARSNKSRTVASGNVVESLGTGDLRFWRADAVKNASPRGG